MTSRPTLSWSRRLVLIVGLIFLSPFCAEVLSGYQGHIDHPAGLLVVFAVAGPLYGTAAVIIRETTRRAGRGWPTMLLLCAAFGLVQAGLIDQALINHAHFAEGPYWQALPTPVPGLDIDVSQVLVFVGGHMLVSFGGPIALMEALAPRHATRPWLGNGGLALIVALYLAAAGYMHYELVIAPGLQSPLPRVLVVAAIVVVMAACALRWPRRLPRGSGRAPRIWQVGLGSSALMVAHFLLRQPEQPSAAAWASVIGSILALGLLGLFLARASARPGWTPAHSAAAAAPALLLTAMLAYAVPVMNESSYANKYLANTITLACLLVLLLLAIVRGRRSGPRENQGVRRADPRRRHLESAIEPPDDTPR